MRVLDDAFLGLMRADPALASVVFEGTVTTRPARYVSVFTRETREINRYTGPHSRVDSEFTVHSVGNSPDQAKRIREQMIARTLDATPEVAGWRCGRVQFVTSRPMEIDRDTSPALWYTVDVLTFTAQPT